MKYENHSSAEIQAIKKQHASLVRAMKVSLSLVLLLLAGACLGAVLWIPTMANIIRHTLPGSALPLATQFVLGHANWFACSALLFTIFGLAVLIARRPAGAIAIATVLAILMLAQWQFVIIALQLPLVHLAHALER